MLIRQMLIKEKVVHQGVIQLSLNNDKLWRPKQSHFIEFTYLFLIIFAIMTRKTCHPKQCIFCGDYNAHGVTISGKKTGDFILQNDLAVFNDPLNT